MLLSFINRNSNVTLFWRIIFCANVKFNCETYSWIRLDGQPFFQLLRVRFYSYAFLYSTYFQAPSLEDNVDYHFIAFVEKDGILWDLDGRKTAPVNCGASSPETFLMVSFWPSLCFSLILMNFSPS